MGLKNLLLLPAAAFMAAAALFGCRPDDTVTPSEDPPVLVPPDPPVDEPPVQVEDERLAALEENTITVDGQKFEVVSKLATRTKGGFVVVASPTAGLATMESFPESDYISVWVNPSLVGVEFDCLRESTSWSVEASWGTLHAEASNLIDGGIQGVCLVRAAGEGYEAFLSFTTADGTEVSMRTAVPFTPGEEYDSLFCYGRDGSEDPVRSVYYHVEDGNHILYLSSGTAEYFDQMIESAYYYCVISVATALTNGDRVDLSKEKGLVRFYSNIYDENTDAVSGTISVSRAAQGKYSVSLDCMLGNGYGLKVSYDGTFISVEEGGRKYSNSFTYKGEEKEIKAVFIDRSTDALWNVYVSPAVCSSLDECRDAGSVVLSIPPFGKDMQTFGFSRHEGMSISYDGDKWSAESGDLGTVEASLDGTTISLAFRNYVNLTGEYQGETVIAGQ